MSYEWTQLGVTEITNLYLYGTPTTPNDLANESLIRPVDIQNGPRYGADITVNINSFMDTGPGRFALGSQSALVQAFFSAAVNDSWFVKGYAYTKQEIVDLIIAHGQASQITNPDNGQIYYGINLKQVLLGDASGDYWERAYIWNSGAFKLANQWSLTPLIIDYH